MTHSTVIKNHICTMKEKEICDEVLNELDFEKVLEHKKKCHLSAQSKLEEMNYASELMKMVIGSTDNNGKFEIKKGIYLCKAEKEDGVLVSLLLECSDHITSYQYCQ